MTDPLKDIRRILSPYKDLFEKVKKVNRFIEDMQKKFGENGIPSSQIESNLRDRLFEFLEQIHEIDAELRDKKIDMFDIPAYFYNRITIIEIILTYENREIAKNTQQLLYAIRENNDIEVVKICRSEAEIFQKAFEVGLDAIIKEYSPLRIYFCFSNLVTGSDYLKNNTDFFDIGEKSNSDMLIKMFDGVDFLFSHLQKSLVVKVVESNKVKGIRGSLMEVYFDMGIFNSSVDSARS